LYPYPFDRLSTFATEILFVQEYSKCRFIVNQEEGPMSVQPIEDVTPVEFVAKHPNLAPVDKKTGWNFVPEISNEMKNLAEAIAEQVTSEVAAE